MADRFPSLDEFDAGATDVRDVPANADGSSFLDRERALLGEDADQFSTPNDSRLTTVEDADDDLLGGDDSYQNTDGAGVQEFESSFPELDTGNDSLGPSGTITGATSFPHPTSSIPSEEPEVIKQWRSKRDEDITRRDKISEDRKASTINEARQAIDDFYETYNDKKDKNIATTRREEKEFLENRDNTTAGGTSWDRIAKLVDLSGKGGKAGAVGGGKERFRELLVNLRKDEKAPGASGL